MQTPFNNLYIMTATLHNYHRPDQSTLKPIKMFHWLQSRMDEEHC